MYERRTFLINAASGLLGLSALRPPSGPELEPVGLDSDGTIRPINELSYFPKLDMETEEDGLLKVSGDVETMRKLVNAYHSHVWPNAVSDWCIDFVLTSQRDRPFWLFDTQYPYHREAFEEALKAVQSGWARHT